MICPECGAENSASRNFCYVCAAALASPLGQPTASPAPQPVAGAASTTATYLPPTAAPPAQRSIPWFWVALAVGLALVAVVGGWQFVSARIVPAPSAAPAAAKPSAPARATATTTPRQRPNGSLFVPRATRPPDIDGRLSGEWAGDGYAVANVVFGKDKWSGPDDLNGRLWFAWDDENFYLASAVVDDVFSQPSRGDTLYLGDSVEIQWDVDLEGDFDTNEFNADDWHIGLSPGDFKGTPPEAYVWTPRPMTGAAAGIRSAAQRVTLGDGRQGYTIEAAIPWRLLNIEPRGNQITGFTFSISDTDSPAPAQDTLVSTSAQREWHRPKTFNNLILQP
ncbi:MAG: hypothetical protein KIS91_14575 [Anaerolineae bacterium]|nr:hypothetical protein [Anaerolineae bacterium]